MVQHASLKPMEERVLAACSVAWDHCKVHVPGSMDTRRYRPVRRESPPGGSFRAPHCTATRRETQVINELAREKLILRCINTREQYDMPFISCVFSAAMMVGVAVADRIPPVAPKLVTVSVKASGTPDHIADRGYASVNFDWWTPKLMCEAPTCKHRPGYPKDGCPAFSAIATNSNWDSAGALEVNLQSKQL